MRCRRYTRLTNAFSKKLENVEAAVSLHMMACNFVRQHQTLRVSPATDHLWKMEEIVELIG